MKVSKEFWLGTLVVMVLTLFYFGINYLKGDNVLFKSRVYYALYDNVAGIAPSSPVVLNGYKIGQVKDVRIFEQDQQKILIEISIKDANVSISTDSEFQIYDSDLFGGKSIRLILGSAQDKAENKTFLKGSLALGLTESIKQEIEPLKAKTTELFAGLDSVFTRLNDVMRDPQTKEIPQLFASVRNTLKNLEKSTGQFDHVMGSGGPELVELLANARSISENIKANNQKISQAIENFSQISDTLKKAQLGTTVLKLKGAVGQLETFVSDVNQGKGSLGQLTQTDVLHKQLVDAAHSLDLLIDDINQNPNKYLNFSVMGRKHNEGFSKKELEQIRSEINKITLESKP